MHQVVQDKDGHLVYLADNSWMLEQMMKNNPEVTFHFTSEDL
jgi:peptide chain release factor 3